MGHRELNGGQLYEDQATGGGHSACILLFFVYHFHSLSGDLIPETSLKINSINLRVLK